MSTKGKLYEVVTGRMKGHYVIARDERQTWHFSNYGKLMVEFYEDTLGKRPVRDPISGKRYIGVVQKDDCELIGDID